MVTLYQGEVKHVCILYWNAAQAGKDGRGNQNDQANEGDDSSTLVALYDTAEDQEAAGPKAAELLGRLAVFMAAPPERNQVEVPINFIF